MTYRKSLTTVALLLEATMGLAQKSIRQGHHSTVAFVVGTMTAESLSSCIVCITGGWFVQSSKVVPNGATAAGGTAAVFDVLGRIVIVEEKGKTKR